MRVVTPPTVDTTPRPTEDLLARLLPRWTQQVWMAEGHCAGRTELFFPPPAERPQSRVRREAQARAVCADCPVMLECRSYARINREHGFWGGESEEERTVAGFAPPHPIGSPNRLRTAS